MTTWMPSRVLQLIVSTFLTSFGFCDIFLLFFHIFFIFASCFCRILICSVHSVIILAFFCLLSLFFQDNAHFSLTFLVVRTGDLLEQRGFVNYTLRISPVFSLSFTHLSKQPWVNCSTKVSYWNWWKYTRLRTGETVHTF